MRHLVLLALVGTSVLAGCVGSPEAPQGIAPTITEEPRFGAVAGTVLDDEVRPVAGASVVVDGHGLETSTDAAGSFNIEGIPAGAASLLVSHPRYEAQRIQVAIAPEAVGQVEVRLEILPGLAPFNSTVIMEGKFDCAHEVPIWTGDCMIVYDTAAGPVVGNDTLTSEAYEFPLDVGPRWETVVLELAWQEPATNQLDGMRLYLEHGNLSLEGHSVKVARTDGPASPLALRVDLGEVKENADVYPGSDTKARLDPAGEQALIRVFPRGQFYEQTQQVCDPDGRCFLGFGAALDVRFTVFATVFYNDRAPEGFSAVPQA